MGIKKITIALIIVFLVMQFVIAEAKNINQVQDELQQAQQDLEDLKDKLQSNNSQQKSTAAQLKQLMTQLQETERKINNLEVQIEELDESIVAREAELEQALNDLNEREELLGGRVQAIYKYSSLSYASILFKAESLADFLSRFTMMRKLISVDRELIAEISAKRDALEKEKSSLLEAKQVMEIQRQTVEYRRSEYQTRSAQRTALMRRLETDAEEYEKALKELEATSKKLEEQLRQLGDSDVNGTGTFTWPTPGYTWITSAFGYRIHPITKKRSFHTGVDVGIGYGKKIYAADSGTVIHAGSYGGYGLSVIINHGNGRSTLYAHNSKLLVKQGQSVAKGQAISECGTTGLSTGPHLHFEIRINGEPNNPFNFVKKK